MLCAMPRCAVLWLRPFCPSAFLGAELCVMLCAMPRCAVLWLRPCWPSDFLGAQLCVMLCCAVAQALLSEWRSELTRQPLAMSEADACAVLGLSAGPGGSVAEEDMRRAYRQLARKWVKGGVDHDADVDHV